MNGTNGNGNHFNYSPTAEAIGSLRVNIEADPGNADLWQGIQWARQHAHAAILAETSNEIAAGIAAEAAGSAFASSLAVARLTHVVTTARREPGGGRRAQPIFCQHLREGTRLAFQSLRGVRGTRTDLDVSAAAIAAGNQARSAGLPNALIDAIAQAATHGALAALAVVEGKHVSMAATAAAAKVTP